MKRLSLLPVLVFAVTLLTTCAHFFYADSIPTFYVTDAKMFMGPNDGSGDNIFFILTGPGVDIEGVGGMACFDWCGIDPIPDPSIAFTSQIFLTQYELVIVGGKTYNSFRLDISLFDGGGGLNALATGTAGFGDPLFTFNLVQPTNGGWNLQFPPSFTKTLLQNCRYPRPLVFVTV
jgi:hypothetical protein